MLHRLPFLIKTVIRPLAMWVKMDWYHDAVSLMHTFISALEVRGPSWSPLKRLCLGVIVRTLPDLRRVI